MYLKTFSIKGFLTLCLLAGLTTFLLGKDIELQNVDMGIAMCHFELSAEELGLKGNWNVTDHQIKSDFMEYIVSWIANGHV